MRYLSFLLPMVLSLAACTSKEQPRDDRALRAAQTYYEALCAGNYEAYMQGISDIDSLPPVYRDQLLVNVKQFMARQKAEHGGISEVRAVTFKSDSLQHRTDVFLMLCYGDSTKEEIVVPMVERGGAWRMKN